MAALATPGLKVSHGWELREPRRHRGVVLKSSSTGSISLGSRSEAGQRVFCRVTAGDHSKSLPHTFSLISIVASWRLQAFCRHLETKGLREGHRLSETDVSQGGPLAPNLPSSPICAPSLEICPCSIGCLTIGPSRCKSPPPKSLLEEYKANSVPRFPSL